MASFLQPLLSSFLGSSVLTKCGVVAVGAVAAFLAVRATNTISQRLRRSAVLKRASEGQFDYIVVGSGSSGAVVAAR